MRRLLPAVDIVADAVHLDRNESGTIVGPIWLRDGNPEQQADFPEVGWLDSPVPLLASWISELQRLSRTVPARGTVASCHFQGGPYFFTVTARSDQAWVIQCFEARDDARKPAPPLHTWKTGSATFLASAVRAARAVLAQCDMRGWWDDETERLRRCLESGPQPRDR
jgi:hypothetical protein